MIGRLRGVIVERIPPYVVLDVQGVGYEIEVPLSTFADLSGTGEIILYTQLIVREDAHLLYGFATHSRRAWFRLLLKVNGIGPRVALALLSGLSDNELALCIQEGDIARLTRVPGIGRKIAERLLVELRGKQPAEVGTVLLTSSAEAVSALLTLGYKVQEAQSAVERAEQQVGQGVSSEVLIRAALQGMLR